MELSVVDGVFWVGWFEVGKPSTLVDDDRLPQHTCWDTHVPNDYASWCGVVLVVGNPVDPGRHLWEESSISHVAESLLQDPTFNAMTLHFACFTTCPVCVVSLQGQRQNVTLSFTKLI